jgi:CRISPR system Cascade subunit CasE
MYLSRLILNSRCRRVQSEVSRTYDLHRTVMAAFPDDLSQRSERVLFRLEADYREDRLALLVQSWQAPDWHHLAGPGFADYLAHDGGPNPAIKSVALDFSAGQVLAFRLLANPTVKRAGTRVGLVRQEEQMAWLWRKAGDAGFRVVAAKTGSHELVSQFLNRGDAAGLSQTSLKVTHLGVQFDGLLQVVDSARLLETVRRGIGSAKGFGYGMLTLARPRI